MKKYTIDELWNVLESNDVIIYGAGYVGKRFLETCKASGKKINIIGVMTKNGTETLDNIVAMSVNNTNDNKKSIVCIAVHDVFTKEVIKDLKLNMYNSYINISPYLYDLMLGKAIYCNLSIPIKQIFCDINKYAIAARWLAIEGFYGKNNYGYNIYVKQLTAQAKVNTRYKRLERFKSLIKSFGVDKYNNENNVMIMDDSRLIDGAHRVSLLMYHGEKSVNVDMYDSKNMILNPHDDSIYLTRDNYKEFGYTEDEMKILDDCVNRIEKIF